MTERSNALGPSNSQRQPPDVDEALSSMLWTPYERTPTESSTDEDDELPKRQKRILCRSQSNWDQSTTTVNHQHEQHNRYSSALEYLGSDDFMPFSTYILSNCTTTDDFNNHRQHSMENHQQKDFLHYNYRYSNPYFGPLPNLNKWWSSSTTNTKQLPSYESLYAFKSFPNTLSTTSSATALKIISPTGSNNNNNKPNFNGIDNNGVLLPPVTPPFDKTRAQEVSI